MPSLERKTKATSTLNYGLPCVIASSLFEAFIRLKREKLRAKSENLTERLEEARLHHNKNLFGNSTLSMMSLSTRATHGSALHAS